MSSTLKIGEFAELAGMSVKTLRFYANQGLLEPANVDPITGYRFYHASQISDATRILNLREAGVAIADILKLNASDDPQGQRLVQLLRSQQRALRREQALIESRLQMVGSLIDHIQQRGSAVISDLRIITIEPEFVYSIRRTLQHGDTVSELFETAERRVAEVDGRANRPPFMLFHGNDDPEIYHIEVCIPVKDHAVELLPVQLCEGARLACAMTYRGDYSQTPIVRDNICRWLADSDLKPSGPLREVYRKFGADQQGYSLPKRVLAQSSNDYITELQTPVEWIKNQ